MLKFELFYSILQPYDRQSSSFKLLEKRAAFVYLKYGSILSVSSLPYSIFCFLSWILEFSMTLEIVFILKLEINFLLSVNV